MKRLLLFATASLCVLVPQVLRAQNYAYAIGDQPFSTQIPIDGGFIDVNNGEIHMEIPLARHPQRGRSQLNERLVYDSRIWKIISNGGYSWQPTNVPNSMSGWRFVSGLETGSVQIYTQVEDMDCYEGNPSGNQPAYYNYFFIWTDPTGVQHWFTAETQQPYSGFCSGSPINYNLPNTPTATGVAVDGTGCSISVANYSTAIVYDPNGNEVYPTPMDPNGNYFATDSNGNLIDTVGRTPVLVSQSGNHIYYDVLGWNGARNRYTVTTETVNYYTAFNETRVSDASGSLTAIQSIQLPDGSSYSFSYDSGTGAGHYGELTSVTLPTGGTIQYNWTNFQDSFQNENRWLSSMVKDGGTTTFHPATISQCSGSSGCQEKVTATSPDGNDTVYTFTLDSGSFLNAGSWNTNDDVYQGSSTSGGTKLRSTATSYSYGTRTTALGAYQGATGYTQTITLPDVGLTSMTQTALYVYGQPSSVKQWDYYSGSAPSNPTLETDYSNYCDGVPEQTTVKDGGNNQISQTTTGFDGSSLTQTSGLPNHASVSGTRCNPTTTSQWINSPSGSLTTTATYDDAGVMMSQTDPNGTTTYGHDSTDTFVTSTAPPTPSSGVSLASTATYDVSYSGLLASVTDPNLQTTSYNNYDWAGRVGEIDALDAGSNRVGKTTFSYTPTQSSVQRYQNATTFADTETLFDTYGRESRSAVANGQGGSAWYQVDTCYDANGRVNFTSYRYQGNGWGTAKVCSGSGDTLSYDAMSRTTQVAHGDGSGTAVHYSYTGRAIKITDENGVSRVSQADGLGRLTAVCEISSNGSMPGSGSPSSCATDIAGTGFLTTYTYDLINHKTTVSQGGQNPRISQADSIGRSVLTQEPESGQTAYSYAYNSTGLVVTRTRPQANQSNQSVLTTTTTQYDSIGRPVTISYSDGTPEKYLYYDQANAWGGPPGWTSLGPSKGHLTQHYVTADGNWTGATFGYDAMGRAVWEQQCNPSNCGGGGYIANFSYDWLGNLLTAGDGAVATSTYSYSVANEVQSVTSSLSDSTHPPNLVSNVQNGPFGPTSYTYGNGVSTLQVYDVVGRPTSHSVCYNSTQQGCSGGTLLYGQIVGYQGTYVTDVSDSAINQHRTYAYDDFGRLSSMSSYDTGQQLYSYIYDRWGNRWQQNALQGGWTEQLSFNTANNQVTTSGFTYDAAGNLQSDGAHSYTHDAEGNATLIDGGSTAKFVYNALSQRVRVDSGGDGLEYVFNPSGQRVSYWHVNSGQLGQGQAYWGSMPIEFYSNGAAHFQHQDWITTERARTTYSGAIEGIFSSLPFGDGLTTTYGGDTDPYHFAGLEQDYSTDTGHAQFREYAFASGRWLSPDAYGGSYDLSNPQSFNRYTYVLNNPLGMTDPLGLDGGGFCWFCMIGDALAKLFGISEVALGPDSPFKLKPRPNSQPWDEHGIIYGPNIAGALGLPDAGCEFGVCGAGPSSFDPSTGAALNPNNKLQYTIGSILELFGYGVAYANWGDPNERLFGTHWCGPGGGGSETNGLDHFCHIHDLCYQQYGVDARANTASGSIQLAPFQIAGITGCNQALANGAKGLIGRVTGADDVYYWMTGSFGFLYPGTAAH